MNLDSPQQDYQAIPRYSREQFPRVVTYECPPPEVVLALLNEKIVSAGTISVDPDPGYSEIEVTIPQVSLPHNCKAE